MVLLFVHTVHFYFVFIISIIVKYIKIYIDRKLFLVTVNVTVQVANGMDINGRC